jgi:hypothetical protein
MFSTANTAAPSTVRTDQIFSSDDAQNARAENRVYQLSSLERLIVRRLNEIAIHFRENKPANR